MSRKVSPSFNMFHKTSYVYSIDLQDTIDVNRPSIQILTAYKIRIMATKSSLTLHHWMYDEYRSLYFLHFNIGKVYAREHYERFSFVNTLPPFEQSWFENVYTYGVLCCCVVLRIPVSLLHSSVLLLALSLPPLLIYCCVRI